MGQPKARAFSSSRAMASGLQQVAADLTARGAQRPRCATLDIDQLDEHARDARTLSRAELGALDIVLVAPGTLPDQQACQNDPAVAVREFNTNAVSVIALLTPIAQYARSAEARHARGDLVGRGRSRTAVELSVRQRQGGACRRFSKACARGCSSAACMC